MNDGAASGVAHGLRVMFGWRRLVTGAIAATLFGILMSPLFTTISTWQMIAREMWVALVAVVAFGLFEHRPRNLPGWIARWALQVITVAVAIPIAVLALYSVLDPNWYQVQARLYGFFLNTLAGLFVAPWIAAIALMRKADIAQRMQSMAFDLERSELERKALDSRLRLLQAQVEPHFLFNTLANVRELVDSGSPQASAVLENLIAYLRAAVPRLHGASTTIGEEVQLVRSYLELMTLRMPDRLQYTLQVDEAAKEVRCPPTTLLTLVENAVRHGIDPSEEGGRIDVKVRVEGGRCVAEVRDSGVGLKATGEGLGTGLASLRERLEIVFGPDASLRLSSLVAGGVSAEVQFPVQAAA